MTGLVFGVVIVFVILFVATRWFAYYRGELSVAGAETREKSTAQSAIVGAGSGVIVLLMLVLLFVGVTRWEWFGHPVPKAPPVAAPAKQSPPVVIGTNPSPSAGAGVPSPSPQR